MAGRSLMASTEGALGALPKLQPLPSCSVMFFRQGELIPPAMEVFCAGPAFRALVSSGAVAGELIALFKALAGTSAIAFMGSRLVSAMKTVIPFAPATSPKTMKARTRPSLRHKRGEPTYPNSGWIPRGRGTATSSTLQPRVTIVYASTEDQVSLEMLLAG